MPNTAQKSIPLLLIQFCLFGFWFNSASAAAMYNVISFGARPDGKTDSTKAFLAAWSQACGSASAAAVYVPRGRFLLGQARFIGQCTNKAISLTIDGTLVAPSDYQVIGNDMSWLSFENVNGVSVRGGMLDGQGTALWACKNSGKSCPTGATTLPFSNSNNIVVTGLTSLNSQMFHIVFNGCNNVRVQGVTVTAAGNSPNTDGIHIQFSSGVTVLNSKIRTGDDCISIGPGTSNLWIENVACGPGHGISYMDGGMKNFYGINFGELIMKDPIFGGRNTDMGSLGKDLNEAGVQNVTVKTATFTGTQNGVRIKSWGRPSNEYVRNVLFHDIVMVNVQNPIVIDQNYCPSNEGCPGQASGVKISDVTYQDIHGSSATQVAVKFDCSWKNPCSRIRLEDVKLTYKNEAAQALCNNAVGTAIGFIQPESCL